MSKEVTLSKGRIAIVDDADFETVSQSQWHFNETTGYAARRDWKAKRYVLMHRSILRAPKDKDVDHINGDKLDNRRENLRLATSAQNSRNTPGLKGTRSQYKGVSVYDSRFYVRIFVDRKNVYYGRYTDERTAARVYDHAARKHYAEFAYLNLPDEPMSEAEFAQVDSRHKPTSQFRGVAWDEAKQCWVAYIQVRGKFISLGTHKNEEAAARRYNEAALKYHGAKAVTNQLENAS